MSRTLCLVVLLVGCRTRDAPASAGATPSGGDGTPAPALPGAATPREASSSEGYDVADEVLRRDTYLTRAVLVRPLGLDDAMEAVFAESGTRFARLEADERFGKYSCGGIDEIAARPWLDLAARELALHSPALTRASGTRWIVSCRGLHQGDTPRTAIPAASAGTILLDVESYPSEDFFQRTFHHELFHMLDAAEGRLAGDAEWAGLNTPGTRYGSGGKQAQTASNQLGSGNEGFVTEYAMSGADEDKAEMFGFLALVPADLSTLAQRDRVVASKRDLLLRRLARYCNGQPSRIVCGER